MYRILVLALILLASPAVAAEPTHGFAARDMLAMERLSDPRVSPDGLHVAFVMRTTDMAADRGRYDLWLTGIDGSSLRQLTTDPAADTQPRWSADGRSIWFLSTRAGSSQIWQLPLDGGEARQVTRFPLDVTSLEPAPDGKTLLFSADVFPDCATVACTTTRLEQQAAPGPSAQVFDRLFVRHWDTWRDGRRSHLFVVPVSGGEPLDLMRGMDADCPSKPFGGSEDYTFTPDGRGVVFSARDVGDSEPWSTDFDLYHVSLDGAGPRRNLTESNPAWDSQPVFSPDGKTLAYLAMQVPGYESDRNRVVLQPWPEGPPRTLTESWDRSPQKLAFSADGRSIVTWASNLGQRSLFVVNAKDGSVRTLVEQGTVRQIAIAGDRVVYALDHMKSPVELYSVALGGGPPRPITAVNAARLAATELGEPEAFTFDGWQSETVHGYVMRPTGFRPDQRYPVAFLIHGGPQGSFGNNFHYRWNPQAYAGAGFAVVMIDFHGSVGYGQDFTDSIRDDWGGKPLVDLQKGLDAALARYPWLDGDRVCALGASYGGYMVNWIAGQWPDRFRCLVNHDGVFDLRMSYYDTEELWFPETDRRGTPWDNPEGYEKHNPVRFVGRWKTPMLVIHGALDFRVVETQGLAAFTALQRRGIPSRLIRFPDENHWVLKPSNSVFWHDEVLSWLERWLH